MQKAQNIKGIFESPLPLQIAIEKLKVCGFRGSDISVLIDESSIQNHPRSEPRFTFIPLGIIMGALLGWAAVVGIISFPGDFYFHRIDPLFAVLLGGGIGGLVTGVLGGGFASLVSGAGRSSGNLTKNNLYLTVQVEDEVASQQVKNILSEYGARAIEAQKKMRIT